MSYKDYYKILGIDSTATPVEIEAAYQKLAARYSSEQLEKDDFTQTVLNDLNEAYLVLTDEGLRQEYDTQGADWKLPDDFLNHRSIENEKVEEGPFKADAHNLASLFQSVIEKGLEAAAQFDGLHQKENHHVQVQLPFRLQDAFDGSLKTIQVNGEELNVNIPKGAYAGMRMRFAGKGREGPDGKRGDLFVTLVEQPHHYFFRNGNNLLYHASIDMYTALLGGRINVPTPAGRMGLTIPKGVLNNSQLRVVGAGMPLLNDPDRRGDFFVELHIETPRDLSEEEIELIKRLRDLRG